MRSPLLTVMSNAAIKAGHGLLRDFGEVDQLQVSRKGVANFVTKSDVRTEKKLVAELKKAKPDYGFLLEEQGELPGKDKEFRWIIDPLDGTSNFIHAVPYFCISIGLERTIKPGVTDVVAGVIYDPIHNELFVAEKNKGAFLNDRRLAVSSRDQIEDAMLATGNPRFAVKESRALALLKNAFSAAGFVRYTGSSALDLAYVAAGRYDGCWFAGLKPWDCAAGLLLVREAGGLAVDANSQPATPYSQLLVAASQAIQPKLMKLLAG